MDITLKKLSKTRTQATIIFDADAVTKARDEVIIVLSKEVELPGFRKGNVPKDVAMEHLAEDRIQEEVVHRLLPAALKEITENNELKPIIRPRVELTSTEPLTVAVTIVEQPEVKVKGAEKLKVPKVDKKDAGSGGSKTADSSEDPKIADSPEQKKQRKAHEERQERERREKALFDLIAEKTVVELAPEMVDEEMQGIIESHVQKLEQHKLDIAQWLQQVGKTQEDFLKEVREAAEQRMKIRFGVTYLIDLWKIEVNEEEIKTSIQTFLAQLPEEYRKQLEPLYEKGARNYEQFRSQKLVDQVVEKILAR